MALQLFWTNNLFYLNVPKHFINKTSAIRGGVNATPIFEMLTSCF